MEKEIHPHFEIQKYPRNSIAAPILNAFYSALILKKLEGVAITPAVEQQVLEDVYRRLNAIQKMIQMAETVLKPKGSR